MRRVLTVGLVLMMSVGNSFAESPEPIRIGWIGAMTGAVAKYGASEAAILAMEDINREGGINGRPLKLELQDGRCQAKDAIDATNGLIQFNKVRFLVGGHCSTESLAMAPIVERSGALMVAAITSSPKLSGAGDRIFRITAPNVRGVDLLVPHVLSKRSERKVAVVYEETEYAEGLAHYFVKSFSEQGGKVLLQMGYKLGETDFLSFVTKIRGSGADAIYLSAQSPDSAIQFLAKARQVGLQTPVLGNEITGNAVESAAPEQIPLFDGVLFAEPRLSKNSAKTKSFVEGYKKRFGVTRLPNGFWTMEAYDAVRVLADAIARCGEDVEKVKQCLYKLSNYEGASGSIAFDANGDGVREYGLKVVTKGVIEELP